MQLTLNFSSDADVYIHDIPKEVFEEWARKTESQITILTSTVFIEFQIGEINITLFQGKDKPTTE